MKVAGLIAAAGLSSRMGAFKPLLRIDGESLIRRVIAALREGGCGEIVVVTGHRAAELERELAGLADVACVFNPAYAATQQLESARLGLRRLEGRCDALLFTPADVPYLSAAVTRALLACDRLPALPVCAGREGHPLLLPASAIPALLRYDGEGGLRGAVERCASAPYRLEIADPGPTWDVDTPEEFEEVKRLCQPKP